jgi:hypothetical protein
MLGKICSADQNGAIVCGRFRSFTVTDEGKIFACVGWDNATGSDRKFDLSETKIDML